ncbi:UDP-N-acetylglucosamine 2-epimerase (hydrolyzing) [Salinimicrobium tongyeongense]|uniref:UDP-N-acetylglucosamine 2-epimerase (Hydrolyzing) n=1 Tax=Salinimicrobium tongyeongense TaxID=2809707 RepID=A0ABY6NS89_9FLAO|nr:UDP-N-acetylglucosamine 2-epimerase [Salinimicrobium tongyeongense]UZH55526.1 UDP-N-acetylglucosamine 2-epimerase (hydrolyzing) [Salinimicrobium tongyeongense]
MRKVCVVTGTRAEYGIMQTLIKIISEDKDLDLQLVVTGMHLSPEFGLTYKEIEKDGFKISKKVEMLLSSDSEVGILKSMGLAQIGFAEAFVELRPDIVLVLGDRYEIFSAVSAAMVSKIPVAHLHGGEATEGLIDEPIRHSVTKMSHLHFTATETYRKRVIQMGENPERVFNVGTPLIDNILKLDLLNRKNFEEAINFKLNEKNLMITFHPVTLEDNTAEKQFRELLEAITGMGDTNFIFTKPNSDTNGRIIIQQIDDFVSKNPHRACAFTSLGQKRYLSALSHVDVVLGNSSSGLTEAPSFKAATVDIGDRQKGRIKATSVISCEPTKESIGEALKKAFSKDFQSILKDVKNPYGEGGASKRIVDVLKNFDYTNILKKKFYDIKF